MVMGTKTPQGVRLNPQNTLELSQGMSIQVAINTADAHGGNWTILLYPGAVYNEGDLTPSGAANITIKGMGAGAVIAPAAAPAIAVINATAPLNLEDITVISPDATMPAVLVNTAGAFIATRCNIVGTAPGYGLQMLQGSADIIHSSLSPDTHLSTARCLLDCFFVTFLGDIITAAEPLNHDIDLMSCEMTNGSITSLATGATVIACDGVSTIDAITNSGTGLFTIRGSYVDSINCLNAGGSVRVRGGTVNSITRAVGSVVWWQDNNTLKVIACDTTTDTVIGWAIAEAAAGDVILLHPGTYDEPVVCKAGVNLKGIGLKGSVVIQRTDSDIITLANNIEIADLTVRLVTPNAARYLILDNAAACTAKMTNLVMEITTPSNFAHNIFRFSGAGTYTIERCSYDIGGNGSTYGVNNQPNAATIKLVGNDFTMTNPNAQHIGSPASGTWTGSGNRWTGTSKVFSINAGTFTFDNCALLSTRTWVNTGSTITLRNCAIEAPVVAGNGALVRMKNCSYRAIQRTATGNIVDESPELKDAPWHIERWTWQAALANAQVGVRGAPVDGGSGQVHLPVTDGGAASRVAVEANAEVVGTLGTEFTPAKTPRFITQIAIDNWATAATNFKMFFGLRETLGDNVPVANEDHAGFEWDATNFNAINGLGANKSSTALTTPGNGVHVQLEVIVVGGVQVEFYINGVLVHTETNNVPAAVLDWQHLMEALANSTATTINGTMRNGGTQECPS